MTDAKGKNTGGNKDDQEDFKKIVKKRTRIMTIVAAVVVATTLIHLSFIEVTSGYFESILSGDIIAIVPLVLLSWLLIGWYILFRFFRNIP